MAEDIDMLHEVKEAKFHISRFHILLCSILLLSNSQHTRARARMHARTQTDIYIYI